MLLPTIRSRCQRIALFDNYMDYDFAQKGALVDAIHDMRYGAGMAVASKSSEKLIHILAEIKAAAEESAKLQMREMKSEQGDVEANVRKRLEEELKAFQESEYRSERELFLSALHTWFSQLYLLANGISEERLPNPEIFEGVAIPVEDVHDARHALDCVEHLLDSLHYNVDEKLCIENFCQQVCEIPAKTPV